MANHLFKNLRIVDSRNSLNGEICDIEVRDGIIYRIGKSLNADNAEVIDCENLSVSPGLFDMQVTCGEPGEEEKETFDSLEKAAISGGITGLILKRFSIDLLLYTMLSHDNP